MPGRRVFKPPTWPAQPRSAAPSGHRSGHDRRSTGLHGPSLRPRTSLRAGPRPVGGLSAACRRPAQGTRGTRPPPPRRVPGAPGRGGPHFPRTHATEKLRIERNGTQRRGEIRQVPAGTHGRGRRNSNWETGPRMRYQGAREIPASRAPNRRESTLQQPTAASSAHTPSASGPPFAAAGDPHQPIQPAAPTLRDPRHAHPAPRSVPGGRPRPQRFPVARPRSERRGHRRAGHPVAVDVCTSTDHRPLRRFVRSSERHVTDTEAAHAIAGDVARPVQDRRVAPRGPPDAADRRHGRD